MKKIASTIAEHEKDLYIAAGLIKGLLRIKEMEEFNKQGLIEGLEQVGEILDKILEDQV